MLENNNTSLKEEEISSLFTYITSLIFDQLPIPINIVDKDCKVIVMNKAFLKLLNLKHEDVEGKYLPEIDPTVRLPLVLKTGQAEIGQKHKFKDGRECIVDRIPLFYNNKIIGGVGIISIDDLSFLYNLLVEDDVTKKLSLYKASKVSEVYNSKYTFNDILTSSSAGLSCKRKAIKYSTADFTVLITGESGVGKELFAHSIHNASLRKEGPFIPVNCGAIPETLIESELFGYEEGAFTGAQKSGKKGKFELANGGTIFFDEIGELPLSMQTKLLRVLQEKELEKVGSNKKTIIDVRVIAATNASLEDKVKQGKFRLDLFYRLNVLNLKVPSLRERGEDIQLLAEHFATKLYQKLGIYKIIPDEIMKILKSYSWPGNVRELKNIIDSIIINSEDTIIKNEDMPEYILKNVQTQQMKNYQLDCPKNSTLKDTLKEIEMKIIYDTLKKCNYNKKETCKTLGIPRMTLYRKLNENHNIK
jgi:transcriptional regulator with PAS, ATPase and Fis domain